MKEPIQTSESILASLKRAYLGAVKNQENNLLSLEDLILKRFPEVGPDFRKARECLRNAMSKLDT